MISYKFKQSRGSVHMLFAIVAMTFLMAGCQKDGINPLDNEPMALSGYYLPKSLVVGMKVTIPGIGIGSNEVENLYLRPEGATDSSSDVQLQQVTTSTWNVSFTVPDNIAWENSNYVLILKRPSGDVLIERSEFPAIMNMDDLEREPIEGDAMIVMKPSIETTDIPAFAVGQELIVKGNGFLQRDSIYFTTADNGKAGVAPSVFSDKELKFVVPATAVSGMVTFAREPYVMNLGHVTIKEGITGVSGVVLPTEAVVPGQNVQISGVGFAEGDNIVAVQQNVSRVTETSFADNALTFTLPSEFTGNEPIQILLSRGENPLLPLGFVYIDQAGGFVTVDPIPAKLPTGLNNKVYSFTIHGEGFLEGDIIRIGTATLPAGKTVVTPFSITSEVSGTVMTTPGVFPVYVRRGSTNQTVGEIEVVEGPRIGDFAYGGVVFWLDPSDPTKGMVCHVKDKTAGATPNNTNDRFTWGYNKLYGEDGPIITPSSRNTAIGTGPANTEDMIRVYGDASEVANYCNDLEVTVDDVVYDDWFLPSFEELMEVYNNRTAINNTAKTYGGTNFVTTAANANLSTGAGTDGYASSSSYDTSKVLCVNFNAANGGKKISNRHNKFRVRAVRNFEYGD